MRIPKRTAAVEADTRRWWCIAIALVAICLIAPSARTRDVAYRPSLLMSLMKGEYPWRLVFDPKGGLLIVGSNGIVGVFDLADGKRIRSFECPDPQVTALRFSSDGNRLAVGGDQGAMAIWDTTTWKAVASHKGRRWSTGENSRIAFSADLSRVVEVRNGKLRRGRDNVTLYISETIPRKLIRKLKSPRTIYSVTLSDDGRVVAAGDWRGVVSVWNVESGVEIRQLAPQGGDYKLTFAQGGRLLVAAGSNGTIGRWNADTWESLKLLRFGPYNVPSVASSPDGRLLASGDAAGNVCVWDLSSETCIGHYQLPARIMDIAFSPDGKTLGAVTAQPSVAILPLPLPAPPSGAGNE